MLLSNRALRVLATHLMAGLFASGSGGALAQSEPLVGAAAFGDWRADNLASSG